ncbi:MAG TPA: VTT domain-containing protein [Gemmatimonadaceae bacterium]|nr:VTT domain-containing protein [Gemmatimonadaceae bacterium]
MRPSDWARLLVPLLLIAAFLVAAWKLGYFNLKDPSKLTAAADRAQNLPWFGPVFAIAYGVVAAFAAPVSPLAYGAGAMFGVVQGTIWVWTGSMIGGTAGYWLARGAWAGAAKRMLGRYQEKLQDLERGNAFLTVLRVQLLPIVPFGVFNYAAGATKVPFLPYLLATAIGVIPGSIAAVYVGDRVAAGFRGGGKSAFLVAAIVMAALFALSFLPNLIKKLRGR